MSRDITHVDGTGGRFNGTATFMPEAGGLSYVEEGRLRLGQGQALSATQRYRWDADLRVYFDDGRFFHQVPCLHVGPAIGVVAVYVGKLGPQHVLGFCEIIERANNVFCPGISPINL